jgi:endonuclease/exonuclease/phosphatase family metal-dependent hydrolase
MTNMKNSKDSNAQLSRFSIGTWNMDHWKRTRQQREKAWEYLETRSGTDVMLLQESVVPSSFNQSQFVYREIGGSRPWGSSVVALSKDVSVREIDVVHTRYSTERFSMQGTFPGTIIVARNDLPGIGPITCISVYGLINVYAQTTMLRIIADLIPLFDSRFGSRVVLGGDFNLTTACSEDTPELPRYRAILGAVESLGLINLAETAQNRPESSSNCPCCNDECFHIPTYNNTQIDWLYATPELARRCTNLRVDNDVVTAELSDHAPIIAEFQVPLSGYKQVVDAESFVEEMRFIAGSEEAQIADGLINWASRKHHELLASGHRMSYDRLPVGVRADKPMIWFQLDIPSPSGLQWTFSITGDGQIVINFQRMTAPYDNEEARERLWSTLNQIEGVSIEKRLNGRPKFPLRTLMVPGRLKQFTKIFSDMIDATLRHNNMNR